MESDEVEDCQDHEDRDEEDKPVREVIHLSLLAMKRTLSPAKLSSLFVAAMSIRDIGPWRGPTEEEWVHRIADPLTPVGETIPWIKQVSAEIPLPHSENEVQ